MLTKFPNPLVLSIAVATALTAPAAHAADTKSKPATAAMSATEGPTVEVTARREPTALNATTAAVRVIDRAEIQRRQAGDLLDLLRGEAGIDIVRSGGPGQATTMFLRGTNSNHTLFLIDGVRVESANSGLFDLAHLPVADIERIEIVRGPRAAYWGSDAIGGVVQIFTHRPDGATVSIRGGRYGTAGADLGYGEQDGRVAWSVAAGREHIQGFSATNALAFGHDPDRDSQGNTHANLHVGTEIGQQAWSFAAIATRADVEFDQGTTAADNTSATMSLSGPLGADDRWTHRLDLGHAREDLDTPAYYAAYASRRDTLDWHHQFARSAQTRLSGGINALRERGGERETFGGSDVFRAHRDNTALYASAAHRIGAHDLELTARHDHSSVFGGHTTTQAAWAWSVAPDTRLRASVGEGFRAPSLNELYSPGFGGLFAGNPNLQPEASRSIEVGVKQTIADTHTLALSAFRTRIDGLISFTGGDTYQAENILRAAIDGIELEYAGQADAWSWQANATWQDARNRDTGLDLLRRPGRKLSARADYRFDGGATLGVEGLASGPSPDFGGPLAGYGLIHLVGNLPVSEHWQLGLRLENLFDRDYALIRGYNTPGRGVYMTLRSGD